MKGIVLTLVADATVVGVFAWIGPANGQVNREAAPVFVTEIPPGYRDWKLISVSQEAGNLNRIGAVLGS